MKKIASILSIFAFLITLSACGDGGASFDISIYAGAAYEGAVTATATLPDGQPAEGSPTTLDGSVQIEDLGGSEARLTVALGPFPLPIEGTYNSNGARFLAEDDGEEGSGRWEIRINEDGEISGTFEGEDVATGDESELSIAGSATASTFTMTWEGETTEGDTELPAGSEIRLAFDLSR